MRRRSFLVASLAAAISSIGGSIASAAVKKPANAFAKTASLKQGVPTLIKAQYKGLPKNLLVTKQSATKFIVLDATCTHEGCLVRPEAKELRCPCHGARFAADGTVLGGPAPEPLAKSAFTVKSGYLCFK